MAAAWVLLVGLSLSSLSVATALEPPDCQDITYDECQRLWQDARDRAVADMESEMGGPRLPFELGGPMVAIMGLLYCLSPLVALAITCIYKAKVTDRRREFNVLNPGKDPYDDFEKGLCDCWSAFPICIMVCCCTQMRLADTLHSTRIVNFWLTFVLLLIVLPLVLWAIMALGVFLAASIDSQAPMYILPFVPALLIAALFAKWRSEFRKKLGMSEGHFGKDFLFQLLGCGPCMMGQDALELDERTGVETKMCDIVEKGNLLVGGPVVAGHHG
mmetsp:Transcript_41417/g.81871  ORF Transcript_41417/g.81871 Transcript_41417/m.81871 type:complete len:273 (+) Transcript_41417:52-870(+)